MSLRYISTKNSEKSRETYDVLTDKITLSLSAKSVLIFSVLLDGSVNFHARKSSALLLLLLLFYFSALFAYRMEITYYIEKIEKNNQVHDKNDFDCIEFCIYSWQLESSQKK